MIYSTIFYGPLILIIVTNPSSSSMQLHSEKMISVYTLNYSGILDSPYEFYSYQLEKQERQISEICRKLISLLPNYDPKTFKWDIGKIDQLYHRQRYTPIYDQQAGIQNGCLIDRKKFQQLWQKRFKTLPCQKFTKEQQDSMKLFDFLMYCTIVVASNNLKDLSNIHFEQCSAEKYRALQTKFFQKSFINEERKIEKTLNVLAKRQVDIIFLQEASQMLRKAVQQSDNYFQITKNEVESTILIKKSSFNNLIPETEMQFKTPNWNQDTVWCRLGKLVLASVHLSSKPQKNQQQVATVLEDIRLFKKNYPQYHILIGIDANCFIDPKQNPDFHIFPAKEEVATTNKERTWMQPQVRKSDVVAKSCKDHIISDLTLSKCDVTLINGSNLTILIPTEAHPYDHYLVCAQVHTEL